MAQNSEFFDEDELRLRRFLDGELDEKSSAEIGRRLGSDPELARRAAAELGVSALLSGLHTGPRTDPLAACRRVRALFDVYRRQVARPQEVAELSAHFAGCPGCEAEYEIFSRPDRPGDFDGDAPCRFERAAATATAVVLSTAVFLAIVLLGIVLTSEAHFPRDYAQGVRRAFPPELVTAVRGEVAGYLARASEAPSGGREALWIDVEKWLSGASKISERETAAASLSRALNGDDEGRALLARLVDAVEPHVPAGEERRNTVYALLRDVPVGDGRRCFERAVRNWEEGDPIAAARAFAKAVDAAEPPVGAAPWLATALEDASGAPSVAVESLLKSCRRFPDDAAIDRALLRLLQRGDRRSALAAATEAAERGLAPEEWSATAWRFARSPSAEDRLAAARLLLRSPSPQDRLAADILLGTETPADATSTDPFSQPR
jgi:hypothetical protein